MLAHVRTLCEAMVGHLRQRYGVGSRAIGAVTVFPEVSTWQTSSCLLARKDGYGVQLVVHELADAVAALEGVTLLHLNLSEGSDLGPTDGSRYQRIREAFVDAGCCLVVVTGLPCVSDVLFKWCAEFTKSNPWCYVFFDGLDVAQLLPENRDRCVWLVIWHGFSPPLLFFVSLIRMLPTLSSSRLPYLPLSPPGLCRLVGIPRL